MSEDDDRRGGGKALHIIGEPGELLRPKLAHAASLEVHHIVETDEMDTVLVERIPACALGVLVEADMAVGNLQESEAGLRSLRRSHQAGFRNAAGNRP